MDLIYTYFGYSDRDETTLRTFLRSLDVFGKNVGRVVVAGRPPSWLSNEVVSYRVDVPNDKSPKYDKIIKVLERAFCDSVIGGHLLYCPEDVVLDETTDLSDYPWYCRRETIRSIEDHVMTSRGGALITRYKMALADTRDLLERHGYRAFELTGHFLSHIDAEDLGEVLRLYHEPHKSRFGYDIGCLFGNIARERLHFSTTLAKECFSNSAPLKFPVEQKSRFEV